MPLNKRRLREIEVATIGPLSDLAMWSSWQDLVICNLGAEDKFQVAKNHLYVLQPSPNDADYESVTSQVFNNPLHAEVKKYQDLDLQYGALMVPTSRGPVNRMWLDAVLEADFINRHCGDYSNILEIGSGYGRLAFLLPEMISIQSYTCVDPVPISTYLCEWYIEQNLGSAKVITLDKIDECKPTLAINIHSWSECTVEQVAYWISKLMEVGTQWIFTKPHTKHFHCWNGGEFGSILNRDFEPVALEEIGLNGTLHVMWKRRRS